MVNPLTWRPLGGFFVVSQKEGLRLAEATDKATNEMKRADVGPIQ